MTHLSHQEADGFAAAFTALVEDMGRALLGKEHAVRLTLTCLVSGGHLLLEDLPGTGKTMLARSLAHAIDGRSARIQFTPDLLPTDVTGVTVYEQQRGEFTFHPGPIFANIVLADEINRASPKTQSAMLEVMEEGRVSVDGRTHEVPSPFCVIATQNPVEQAGTYALPEAQLDRFLMRIELGHPDAAATEELLLGSNVRDRSTLIQGNTSLDRLIDMSTSSDRVVVDPAIARYVRQLAEASREAEHVMLGLSSRGALAWVRAAKTWAASRGRAMVLPDDIATLAVPVLNHRILLDSSAQFSGIGVDAVIEQLLAQVPPPATRD